MNENNQKGRTSISKANTPEEIGEFWDSHSLADYAEETHEVAFELRAQRRRRITLDPELYTQLEAEARTRGISPETLINRWLTEKLQAVMQREARA